MWPYRGGRQGSDRRGRSQEEGIHHEVTCHQEKRSRGGQPSGWWPLSSHPSLCSRACYNSQGEGQLLQRQRYSEDAKLRLACTTLQGRCHRFHAFDLPEIHLADFWSQCVCVCVYSIGCWWSSEGLPGVCGGGEIKISFIVSLLEPNCPTD